MAFFILTTVLQHIRMATMLYDETEDIMTEPIKDDTTEVIETTPDDDKTGDVDKEKDDKGALPDADEKTVDKTQAVQSVLDEYDIESPEQLGEFLKNLSGLKNQLGDSDLEELKENSALLRKYQKHWAKQEEEKREDGETPEETIARKNKKIEQAEKALKDERRQNEEAAKDKALLKSFSNTVKSVVREDKALPVEYHDFMDEFLGVSNEINEVDLEDKAGIKRIAKAATKKLLAHNQRVIKNYLKGKTEMPKISTSSDTPVDGPVQYTTKKQAKLAMIERLKAGRKE